MLVKTFYGEPGSPWGVRAGGWTRFTGTFSRGPRGVCTPPRTFWKRRREQGLGVGEWACLQEQTRPRIVGRTSVQESS